MKLYVRGLCFALMLFCAVCQKRQALGAEVEMQRGSETEVEIYLEGSEQIYSYLGFLKADTNYIRLEDAVKKNSKNYQEILLEDRGGKELILLSARGAESKGLTLRIRVFGKRIGETQLLFQDGLFTNRNGQWIEDAELPNITVSVLPNPLEVTLLGTMGNAGWYTSTVKVRVQDKDAAVIWYDLGYGKERYTGPVLLSDENREIIISTDDGYGYTKYEKRQVWIDTTPPVFTVSREQSNWQRESVILTAQSLDDGSGVYTAGWAVSDSEEYAGEFAALEAGTEITMEKDGSWYLHLSGTDVAGNTGQVTYGPYRKDSVAPEVSFVNLQEGQIVEKVIVPEIKATDDRSGVNRITCCLDGQEWLSGEITGSGNHTFSVTVEDNAGNTTTESVAFYIHDPVEILVSAEDSCYTGEGVFSAKITYDGEPMVNREAEFYLNEESIGTGVTDENGEVCLRKPLLLAPQTAVVTVRTKAEEENFLLEGEGSTEFTIAPETAWVITTAERKMPQRDELRIWIASGELPDSRTGDITKAEWVISLYRLEDGEKVLTERVNLHPEEDGTAEYSFYPETGWYEVVTEAGENSYYAAPAQSLLTVVDRIEFAADAEKISLLFDLPQFGLYIRSDFIFRPEFTVNATAKLEIPGTGIILTENRLTDYVLEENGIVFYGSAVHPGDGAVYSYEICVGYGIFVDKIEVSLWKGTDKTQEKAYYYSWPEIN